MSDLVEIKEIIESLCLFEIIGVKLIVEVGCIELMICDLL